MKAVIIKGLKHVAVEDRPVPVIEQPTDVILKTRVSGLCGFILGHEVCGEVVEVGSAVTKFKVGDIVVSPFSSSCEYVRKPLADGSLFHVPKDVPEDIMLLLGDILPTGYSAAHNARRLLDEDDEREDMSVKDGVAVVIGCGPTMFSKVFATDPSLERRQLAEKHGAIALPLDQLKQAVLDATDGRGADAALELVGYQAALQTGIDLVRHFGVVSSIGMHLQPLKLDGEQLYNKKWFGRCSVNRFFPAAIKVLQANKELFAGFIQHRIRFDQAEEYYALFNEGKVAKTVFVADDLAL
ncbi:hypothetical protein IAU60_001927 [Kwoniella sp. DSM 27419]